METKNSMSEIITGQQAKEHYKEFKNCAHGPAICTCGIMVTSSEVVVAETETHIHGEDVPVLGFFCSTQCANEWLDIEESKDTQQAFLKASEPATESEIREKIESDYINDVA